MEETQVLIVGAGPSGLTMGLALARHGIKSVILEKSLEPDQDPRGVYLNGDAIRILWSLGVREQHFAEFSEEPEAVHFYKSCITNPAGPYYVMRTKDDYLHQALPGGLTHVQPKLEASIAGEATAGHFCEIRRGRTAMSHKLQESKHVIVGCQDQSGTCCKIRCNYLIGADGKRGVVRKSFLEPTAPIRQISNPTYQYEGKWVATNLQLTLPTPETHPDLLLWRLGYTPEMVYDLFCPKAWYFCSPPGKPTAGGRIGPVDQRLWRHEFAQPDGDDSLDAEALFWEHFTPFITRTHDEHGREFVRPLVYPRDCIRVLRCRASTFTHKVVNRWFDRRRILIGDAAHFFPPFGGQGIASGIRDAHQLAWRLALLEAMPDVDETAVQRLLDQWAVERRRSIDVATRQTKMNGRLCNEPESWAFYLFRKLSAMYEMLPLRPPLPNPVAEWDKNGFRGVEGGFFLPEYGGGGKFPQIFARCQRGEIVRSDNELQDQSGLFTLMVMRKEMASFFLAKTAVQNAALPQRLLNDSSIVLLDDVDADSGGKAGATRVLSPTTPEAGSGFDVLQGYWPGALRELMGKETMFALLRRDFHIFALVKSVSELDDALVKLRRIVSRSETVAKL